MALETIRLRKMTIKWLLKGLFMDIIILGGKKLDVGRDEATVEIIRARRVLRSIMI